jgi:pimeloyl-ACP methyl ester carboxylesterase
MERVISRDGTQIAYHRRGTGPPLVLVHGTGAASPVAWPALPLLEEHFTIYALHRRGRRESGDTEPYALEREFEDIAAVVDSVAEPANVLGHSFGALCALEAALLTRSVRKLILYEPALPLGSKPANPKGVAAQIDSLLEAGDREGAWITFMRDIAMLAPQDIDQFKASPAWLERLAAAHTLPREIRAEEQYRFDPQRFKDLHTPALLLLGSESPSFAKEATEALNGALSNSHIAVLPDQEHVAMYTAPDLFAYEVRTFLTAPQ